MFSLIKGAFQNPAQYRKFWVAFGTFVLNVIAVIFVGAVWLPALITFAGTLGVGTVANAKPSPEEPVATEGV